MDLRLDFRILVFGLTVIILLGIGNSTVAINGSTSENIQTQLQPNSLTPRSVIHIWDNSDFWTLGFPGSGISSDPYIIEGYNITSNNDLIAISNTDAYFTIRSNYLNGMSTNEGFGITLNNVKNGLIENNTILDVTHDGISVVSSSNNVIKNNYIKSAEVNGIFLFESSNNMIQNNSISVNGHNGINIESSTDNTVESNIIQQNVHDGITLYSAGLNKIENNIVLFNGFAEIALYFSSNNQIIFNEVSKNMIAGGIYVVETSNSNWIANNLVYNNDFGIRLEAASDLNTIYNNSVFENKNAIHLEYSSNNSLLQNFVYENEFGIELRNADRLGISKFNKISKNTVFRNLVSTISLESMSQNNIITNNDFSIVEFSSVRARDSGVNNSFYNNYWSDWDRSDSYEIGGTANNQDPSPKRSSIHIDTTAVHIDDSGLDSLSGNISISWEPVSDWMNHTIDYSVSYMTEDMNLTRIVSGISDMNYSIDTSIIPDGTMAYIVVEAIDEFKFRSLSFSDKLYLVYNSEHSLRSPSILTPSYTDILTGEVEISWTPANDSWEAHFVKYSVFYFSSLDSKWVPIATEISSTRVFWDTTFVPDGSYYIKVVALGSGGLWTEVISNSSFTLKNEPTINLFSSDPELHFSPVNTIILTLSFIILVKQKRKSQY